MSGVKRGREAEPAAVLFNELLMKAAQDDRWEDVIRILKVISVEPHAMRQLHSVMQATFARMNAESASARAAFLKSLDE